MRHDIACIALAALCGCSSRLDKAEEAGTSFIRQFLVNPDGAQFRLEEQDPYKDEGAETTVRLVVNATNLAGAVIQEHVEVTMDKAGKIVDVRGPGFSVREDRAAWEKCKHRTDSILKIRDASQLRYDSMERAGASSIAMYDTLMAVTRLSREAIRCDMKDRVLSGIFRNKPKVPKD